MQSSTKPTPKKSSHASNWVVLFALLSILIILAGLLLPSLAKSKARAQRIRYSALALENNSPTEPISYNTESYNGFVDNPFLSASENPLSTFSIDVDTASYSNIRRFLDSNELPPRDAVRVEEMLNYFSYKYSQPSNGEPCSVFIQAVECPWQKKHRLVRLGIKAREVAPEKQPQCNLVFLIDVSGSMEDSAKLPLVQKALELLVEKLSSQDRVAIVVYAGTSGLVLDSTLCADREKIIKAIKRLRAGGSTNGGQGIELAYKTAVRNFITGGVNRVILCTDGDFNVGISSPGELARLIKEKARSGVFLTVLGFGMGNYKDSTLEKLADLGNGNYGYIDNIKEARKMLVEQVNGTLITVAKDVKIQVDFNPARVSAYRLIGYENRLLSKEDFHDDSKDAGDMGSGHTVTALYEVVPAGIPISLPKVDAPKYQATVQSGPASTELLTLKMRYKEVDSETSKLTTLPFVDGGSLMENAGEDMKFAAAVAAFGMLLRDSQHKGETDFALVLGLANEGLDGSGYRSEFAALVTKARTLRDYKVASSSIPRN